MGVGERAGKPSELPTLMGSNKSSFRKYLVIFNGTQ